MDPDFDPGEPWRDGLLAGLLIVVLASQILLELVNVLRVHWVLSDFGVMLPLERLLG